MFSGSRSDMPFASWTITSYSQRKAFHEYLFLVILMSHNDVPLSVPGKGMLIPISLGNSNCLGFREDAAFTSTSIGLVSSDEPSCFLNRFSLPGGSAASLFARKRPLHVDAAGGAKSTHINFKYIVYTNERPQMI